MDSPNWLPPMVELSETGGDWEEYNELIYSIFLDDFILNKTFCDGNPVVVDRNIVDGKMQGFWHITSEKGEYERCKRIRWPKALIQNKSSGDLYIWENERKKGRVNLLIYWHSESEEDPGYLVVLKKKEKYYFLVTAYPIEREHGKQKKLKEYYDYEKSRSRSKSDLDTPSTHGR